MRSDPSTRCAAFAGGIVVRLGVARALTVVACGLAVIVPGVQCQCDEAGRERHFETEIRPLLAEHCVRCHGASRQEGGLRLDSRAGLLQGGEGGPVIVSGDAAASRLIRAVRREGALEMPPDSKLREPLIAALTRWVELGAFWPETTPLLAAPQLPDAREHWAFQPLGRPQPPPAAAADRVRTPVDAFIAAELAQAGLALSPEADRRTLIRRLTVALTGLPPTPADVEQFVHDPDPHAYERLVERLLDSPRYGEQWARHWLDVARYSDTKGYVYAREERFWVHAWTYRDWVVQALNEDLPYDRFLLLQLAADQVADRRPEDLAAMGFLTLGRRFLGVRRDVIDDRIDVVTRGTMGLTVACARCHDHKYDPIPTADYYSLYGVFDSCSERLVRLNETGAADAERELAARQDKLRVALDAARRETSARVRSRAADYLHAQLHLDQYPEEGFDQILENGDLLPSFVRRWQRCLHEAHRRDDPVFRPWHAFAAAPSDAFAAEARRITDELIAAADSGEPPVPRRVREAFATPPQSFREVIDRYGAIFSAIELDWQTELIAADESGRPTPERFADPGDELLRRVLYGPGAPCEVPDEPLVHIEYDIASADCTQLWKLQGEVDRWIINAGAAAPHTVALVDRERPATPRIFVRGNPAIPGAEVPRQFLALLSGEARRPFEQGSGRLELARAIIDPDNPLTARVMVNRVWAHHFGAGLVSTPSDFGLRAEPPSHPELLDWLARRFIDEGWSLKALHRLIVLSATFRQSSLGPTDPALLARARQLDPANRLLWRMTPRRLSFEEFRDALLAASGELDLAAGGKPVDLFSTPAPTRRTLYGLVDRQFLPGTLRVFDFANPDLHVPQRSQTTVPQQALFVMNHPLVLDRARVLARSLPSDGDVEAGVQELFRRTYLRPPHRSEFAAACELVAAPGPSAPPPPPTALDWQYGFGAIDEAARRVASFTPLPHFTGSAWQGGPKWPDPKLGWVQLTATGGHPGNDLVHAAIRRWVAPRDMTIAIESKLTHEAKPGDGVRGFIVSSRGGVLESAVVHQQSADLHVAALEVAAGETIDFLVDIGKVLNSDQHLWGIVIRETGPSTAPTTWNSEHDFPRDTVTPLTPWEQLAQVLLVSNEFLFVD